MSVIIPSSKTKDNINLNLSNDNVVSTISYDLRKISVLDYQELGSSKITYMYQNEDGDFVPCYDDSEKNEYATSTTVLKGADRTIGNLKFSIYYVRTKVEYNISQGSLSLEEIEKATIKYVKATIKAGSPDYTVESESNFVPFSILGDNPDSDIINSQTVDPTCWISSFSSNSIEIVYYIPFFNTFDSETGETITENTGLPAYSIFYPILSKISDRTYTGRIYGDITSDADYSISNNEFLTTGLNFSNSIINIGIEPNIISVTDTVEYQVFIGYIHNITVKLEKEAASDIEITLEYSGGLSQSVVVNIAKGSLEASKRETFNVLSQKFIYGSVMPATDNKYWYCSNYELNNYPGTNKIISTIYNDYKNGKQSASMSCKISEYYNEDGSLFISSQNGVFRPLEDENGKKYTAIPMRYYKNKDVPISTYTDINGNEVPRLFEIYSVELNYDNGNIYQQLKLIEKP